VSGADSEHERLAALGRLAALSLDALSSAAYGPEAILVDVGSTCACDYAPRAINS
jgi:hypothetical protein